MSNRAQSKTTPSKSMVKNRTAGDQRDNLHTTKRTFELTPKRKLTCIPQRLLGSKFFNELRETPVTKEVTDEEPPEKTCSILFKYLKKNVQQTDSNMKEN